MILTIILFVILEGIVLWGARRAYETSNRKVRESEATHVLCFGTGAAIVVAFVLAFLWKFFLFVAVVGAIAWGLYTVIMKWVRKTAKVPNAAS